MARSKVVIVGGGFGGLRVAKELDKIDVDVVLIDRTNHHLFQPLLYQVATAGLSPSDIAAPIRAIVGRQKNTTVLMAEVKSIDLETKKVVHDSGELDFDFLVVATGATHSYFGKDDWEKHAPGLKSLADATSIRSRVLGSFEAAERGDAEAGPLLTFAVIGGGPTGVEMAGAIAELGRLALKGDFQRIRPEELKVVLIEAGPRLLSAFDPSLSDYAKRSLEEMGVEVQLGHAVEELGEGFVKVNGQILHTSNVVWAAGVRANPLVASLGTEVDRAGRAMVQPDCSIPGQPNVFVVGDAMHLAGSDGKPLPGVSPVAMQQGKYVAGLIKAEIQGSQASRTQFAYWDKGSMATIGRKRAVAQVGKTRLTGFVAWAAWLFVHVWYLIDFDRKLIVLLQWAWAYFTHRRRARLIT